MKLIVLFVTTFFTIVTTATASNARSPFPSMPMTTTINCEFTEPFLTLTYSSFFETVSIESIHQEGFKTRSNVSLIDKGKGRYVLVDKSKPQTPIAELRQQRGGDGMTSYIYPMTIQYNGLNGACETDLFPRFIPSLKELEGIVLHSLAKKLDGIVVKYKETGDLIYPRLSMVLSEKDIQNPAQNVTIDVICESTSDHYEGQKCRFQYQQLAPAEDEWLLYFDFKVEKGFVVPEQVVHAVMAG